jgi:hypothetical protein
VLVKLGLRSTMEYISDKLSYTINGWLAVFAFVGRCWINDVLLQRMVRILVCVAGSTSWEKKKLLGYWKFSAFNQEYDLRFINGSRSLFIWKYYRAP